MYKVLITGDRNGVEGGIIFDVISELCQTHDDLVIVHGAARGVDLAAEAACKTLQVPYFGFPARWKRYGNPAGPIRNRFMLTSNPDIALGLAFHDNIKESTGTKDMVKCMIKAGIPVRLYSNGSLERVFNPRQIELEL
jgi:hypothetical protein